jgi:agmatinase
MLKSTALLYDHAEITALAAATLGLDFLYVLAANSKMKKA